MQVILNKKEKKELVVELHREGKTIREIASNDDDDINLGNKTKETKALRLFENGKRPIDIAIILDMSYSEVVELQQEYWALKELYDLAFVFLEIKNDLSSFMKLFKLLKQNRMLNEKHILKYLRYAEDDLPSLEKRRQQLSSDVLELQSRKKRLGDEVATQC